MSKHRRVNLTAEQRDNLEKIIYTSKDSGGIITKARILLMADRSQGRLVRDAEIIASLGTSICTIVRTRRQFCEKGLDAILGKRPRLRKSKFNDEDMQHIINKIISEPPPMPYKRWTIRLLASQISGFENVKSISPSMVYKLLQRLNIRLNENND